MAERFEVFLWEHQRFGVLGWDAQGRMGTLGIRGVPMGTPKVFGPGTGCPWEGGDVGDSRWSQGNTKVWGSGGWDAPGVAWWGIRGVPIGTY